MKKFSRIKSFDVLTPVLGVLFVIAVVILIGMVMVILQACFGAIAVAEGTTTESYEVAQLNPTEGTLDLFDFTEEDDEFPKVMVVTGNHVRERQQPNTDCKVTGHYDAGEKVTVLRIDGDWANLENGHYVCADYLRDATDEEIRLEVARVPQFSAEIQTYIAKYNDIAIAVLDDQEAYYFRNHELFAYGPVTTGRNGHKTPTGLYTVTQKRRDFDMKDNPEHHVDHAVFFNGNIAFHDAHWQKATKFGDKKYRPTKGSAGCVRTNDDLMRTLWDYMRVDATRVLVIQSN